MYFFINIEKSAPLKVFRQPKHLFQHCCKADSQIRKKSSERSKVYQRHSWRTWTLQIYLQQTTNAPSNIQTQRNIENSIPLSSLHLLGCHHCTHIWNLDLHKENSSHGSETQKKRHGGVRSPRAWTSWWYGTSAPFKWSKPKSPRHADGLLKMIIKIT